MSDVGYLVGSRHAFFLALCRARYSFAAAAFAAFLAASVRCFGGRPTPNLTIVSMMQFSDSLYE